MSTKYFHYNHDTAEMIAGPYDSYHQAADDLDPRLANCMVVTVDIPDDECQPEQDVEQPVVTQPDYSKCKESENGEHKPDWNGLTEVYTNDAGETVLIEVQCQHCGQLGCAQCYVSDMTIDW